MITALAGVAAAQTVFPEAVGGWIHTRYRNEVRRAWDIMVGTSGVPMGWTGTFNPPNPGTTSAEYRRAVIARVNWARAMGGVPAAITEDPAKSAAAQQAAFMMITNGQLNHNPPSTWKNYTAAGADAAGHSNLCLGFPTDPGCVILYVLDSPSTDPVGRRRWLLYPQTEQMGTGDTGGLGDFQMANALWVIDPAFLGNPRPAVRSDFVAWPPPGYAPYQVVSSLWSFSYPNADFSAARVTMAHNGAAIATELQMPQPGFGENTLVWHPAIFDASADHIAAPAADTTYTVTVSNAIINGSPRSVTYRVTVFDPSTQPAFTPSSAKETLTASGATGTINLTVSPGGNDWAAVSSADWLTITSGASGTGNGAIGWSAAANSTPYSRTAVIVAGDAVTTFTEAGSGAATSVVDVNAASFEPTALAADSIATAFSADLANTRATAATVPLPNNLGGSTATIIDSKGNSWPAGLFFVTGGSVSQVNYWMPAGVANGPAQVLFTSGDGAQVSDSVQIESVSPALFVLNAGGLVAADVLRVRNGVSTYEQVFKLDGANIVDLPVDLGPETDSVYLELYGTGIRAAGTALVTAAIGQMNAPVLYAGASGYVGEDQVNVQLPRALAGKGPVQITLMAAGRIANPVHITIR